MNSNVDLCTRIEGHASIEYIVSKNELMAVNFKTDVFRGFEGILRGKHYLDAPRIASRICGLCHASQAIASTRAIEAMLGVQPSASARAMRAVLMCGELVKSHVMHFYFQGFPDISAVLHDKPLGLEELVRNNPEFTQSMFELIKLGKDVCEAFGGREIHAISPAVGGKSFTVFPKEINQTRKHLEKIQEISRPVLDDLLEDFHNASPAEDFAFKNVAFLALANEPGVDGIYRQDGKIAIELPSGSVRRIAPDGFKELVWTEEGLRGYETSLDESIGLLVGPMARARLGALEVDDHELKDAVARAWSKWKDNMLFNYALQLVDVHESASMALEILSSLSGETARDQTIPDTPPNPAGTGIVEAPRGTLIHHYASGEDNRLGEVDLYIPTRINIPLIDRMLTTRCRALADKGLAMDEIKRRAAMIVRTFDPCISCATHLVTHRP
ncbi:MAG: nickel-dependent hydrogenase large subunit [Candidatus Lokiarchaeota archaeon]|nr:nickel-dependent hydrogenase large subunit [Candidatus Lokiarchaeota archaeon]